MVKCYNAISMVAALRPTKIEGVGLLSVRAVFRFNGAVPPLIFFRKQIMNLKCLFMCA